MWTILAVIMHQNWKRRWFVLTEAAPGLNNLPAKLSYFESHEVGSEICSMLSPDLGRHMLSIRIPHRWARSTSAR